MAGNEVSVLPNNINYKVAKDVSFITTSSFFEADDQPLDLTQYLVSFTVTTITRSRATVLSLTSTNGGLEINENSSTISTTIDLEEGKYLYKYTIIANDFSAVIQQGTFQVVEVAEESENETQETDCVVDEFGPNSVTVTIGYIIESPGDKHYTHEQTTASATWVVNHNLEKYPSIEIVDSANTKIQTDRIHQNKNTLTIYFTSPTTGKVFCN